MTIISWAPTLAEIRPDVVERFDRMEHDFRPVFMHHQAAVELATHLAVLTGRRRRVRRVAAPWTGFGDAWVIESAWPIVNTRILRSVHRRWADA